MIKTTKDQRKALKRVFDRQPLVAVERQYRYAKAIFAERAENHPERTDILTYRQFRKMVQGGWDCIMVPWCGMWLGIETDGYTHS